jgi:phosphoesterase RecJ-like protein
MHTEFSDKVQKIKILLKENTNVVITSHHNPDGDAIGSMLGLHHILKEYGIDSSMVLPNGFPDFLDWLPESKKIVNFYWKRKIAKELINNAQVLFALDYNSPARLEDMSDIFKKAAGSKILIDHHPNPESSFDISISDVEVSSTAELIFEFAMELGGTNLITHNAAECIFTGIMTDTGSFSYACSRPRTFEVIAQLIAKGVDLEKAQQKVYNNFSVDRMRLVGHSLGTKMKVFPEYNSAYISLSRDELNSFNHKIGDTEGLVNYPLSIKGIVFSALFVENTNFIKVSLRSRGEFPVNKVCEEFFHGGGHMNAAGGKSFVSMEETEKIFEKVMEKYQSILKQ